MKNIFKFIFKRPVTISVLVILLLSFGIVATFASPINLLPDMKLPVLGITIIYPGADAKSIDESVTDKVEKALHSEAGVVSVTTMSFDNGSLSIVSFEYDSDLKTKKEEITELISTIDLPSGCLEPTISDIDLNASAVASFALSGASDEEISKDIDALKTAFYNIEGVGRVDVVGKKEKKIKITGLDGLDITTGLIVQALNSNGFEIPLGNIIDNGENVSIRNESNPYTIEELENIPVSIDLPIFTVAALASLKMGIRAYETSKLDEYLAFADNLIAANELIKNLDNKRLSELKTINNNAYVLKGLIMLLKHSSSYSINYAYDNFLKPLITDNRFINLTEDDLQVLSDNTGISIDFLKWLQTNSGTDGGNIKKTIDKLVNYKDLYPNEINFDALAYLLSDGGDVEIDGTVHSIEGINIETGISHDDLVSKLEIIDKINPIGLSLYTEKRSFGLKPTDTDYVVLLFGTEYMQLNYGLLLPPIMKYIRQDTFLDKINQLTAFKKAHSTIYGDPICSDGTLYVYGSDKEILTDSEIAGLYNDLGLREIVDLDVSEDIVRLVRSVEIGDLNLASGISNVTVITALKNVGTIEYYEGYDTYASYEGKEAVIIEVFTSQSANTSKVVKEAKQKVNNTNTASNVVLIEDNAEFIDDSISNILVSLVIGAVLAVIVIFIFIRKIRSSIVIAITMPLSILVAIICLWAMNISLNMVSIGGLAVGVGMLVDNSIVVLESITKHREEGEGVFDACVNGTHEVASSLLASTLTNVCVFIPILFLKGLTKEIFADLVWSIVFSMVMSFISAIFVIPTLYNLLYHKNSNDLDKKEIKDSKIHLFYQKVLHKALIHKGKTCLIALGIFVASLFLVFTFKFEFLPSDDKGIIVAHIEFNDDVTLEEGNNITNSFIEELNCLGNIKKVSSTVRKQSVLSTTFSGSIRIEIDKKHAKTTEYADKIRGLGTTLTGISEVVVNEIDGIVAQITSNYFSNVVNVKGTDLAEVEAASEKLTNKLLENESIKTVKNNLANKTTEYRVDIDRMKCAQLGIDYETTVKLLRVGIAGLDVVKLNIDGNDILVNVQFSENTLSSMDNILHIVVGYHGTEVIHLEDIATLKEQKVNNIIYKEDGLYVASLSIGSSKISTGEITKIINNDAKEVLKDYSNLSYSTSGVSKYLVDAFSGLVVAFVIAFVLLFAVMACQFESLVKPFIVIMAIPFGLFGAILSIVITGTSLNIVSFIGLIMLLGVMVNDAIVMIDRINLLISNGMKPQEAIIQGAKHRLRAIWMTALTTILALIPLSLGLGKGGTLMQPMGIVVLGGLLLGTFVTLFIIPCFFAVIKKIKFEKEELDETNNQD